MGTKITNNEKAFNAFFEKLNGKVYTTLDQLKDDFIDALNENGFVVKRKLMYSSKKS